MEDERNHSQTNKQQTMNLFCVMAHHLTDEQKVGWDNITTLWDVNPELMNQVKSIDPEDSWDAIMSLSEKIMDAIPDDATHFCFAGEPALSMIVNSMAFSDGFIVVQSTTRRESVDVPQKDGSVKKVSVFRHVQWREWFTDID